MHTKSAQSNATYARSLIREILAEEDPTTRQQIAYDLLGAVNALISDLHTPDFYCFDCFIEC